LTSIPHLRFPSSKKWDYEFKERWEINQLKSWRGEENRENIEVGIYRMGNLSRDHCTFILGKRTTMDQMVFRTTTKLSNYFKMLGNGAGSFSLGLSLHVIKTTQKAAQPKKKNTRLQ
jgi:hypothetical protein